MAEGNPARVAIIGGGCAAMAAAFELTRPQLAGRFEVSIYQAGWRLGGKGASGRGAAARIEEHGLHLWMGFYENAFRLMRECYAELGRDPASCPIADWTDAFVPAPLIGVADRVPNGDWEIWEGALPPAPGLPGDPGALRWTVAEYMSRSVTLVRNLLETMRPGLAGAGSAAAGGRDAPAAIAEQIMRLVRLGELATVAGFTQAVSALEMVIGGLSEYPQNVVLALLDGIARSAREVLEQSLTQEVPLRRVWHVVDLTLATLRGMVRFGIATDPRGFDAIDDYDCREWLLLCGASEAAVNSAWVRALYDLGFSYEDGDVTRPRIAAGQALRSMLRAFFTYRGSFFFRLQAGMGDVVFAPFYEVLRRRGVRFNFFHRLRHLRLAPAERIAPGELPFVERLEFEEQARIRNGAEYEPLVDIDGLPCWPSTPRWEQLENGEAMRGRDFESHSDQGGTAKALRVGADFDFIVLAVGLGAVPHVCAELVARDARWRAMVDHVKTVPTQAFQIWLNEDMATLGRPGEPLNVSGFVEPFDTWADMAHLIPREQWREAPRALAYFCSVLDDGDGPAADNAAHAAAQRERVREHAVRFLDRDIGHLWPGAVRPDGGFRWELLVDPSGADPGPGDAARFATQFWTANVNPSDRYVLSLPGSSAYRISPLEQSCDNLTVAGDWTACGFNAGCVEAAVMSGRLAAHALALSPPLAEIVGFDHP
jgi:uncharacterized protein with NAD-binding domain and iron-sulfur cluster